MKKIHVIVQKKDIVSALESLRESGSVHVEHEELLTGYQLEDSRTAPYRLKAGCSPGMMRA